MRPTPAVRLHALAEKAGLSLREFSPGLRVWAIWERGKYYQDGCEPLAFGVPHSQVAAKIAELAAAPRCNSTPSPTHPAAA